MIKNGSVFVEWMIVDVFEMDDNNKEDRVKNDERTDHIEWSERNEDSKKGKVDEVNRIIQGAKGKSLKSSL